MLHVDVVSIFPQMFEAVTAFGITGRARDQGLWDLVAWNPRDFTPIRTGAVDDRPFGGGPGMVMLARRSSERSEAARQRQTSCGVQGSRVIYLSPQGERAGSSQGDGARGATGADPGRGRYEGVDERLVERDVDDEISVGDYVLDGRRVAGDDPDRLPWCASCRARWVTRTRSRRIRSWTGCWIVRTIRGPRCTTATVVPPVLMSGHHAEIRRWRLKQALGRTHLRRPDLLARRGMSAEEQALLEEFLKEYADRGVEHESFSNSSSRKRCSVWASRFPTSRRAIRWS